YHPLRIVGKYCVPRKTHIFLWIENTDRYKDVYTKKNTVLPYKRHVGYCAGSLCYILNSLGSYVSGLPPQPYLPFLGLRARPSTIYPRHRYIDGTPYPYFRRRYFHDLRHRTNTGLVESDYRYDPFV